MKLFKPVALYKNEEHEIDQNLVEHVPTFLPEKTKGGAGRGWESANEEKQQSSSFQRGSPMKNDK